MLGRRSDWLPARAEPVWFNAYRAVNAEGQDDDFAATLEVQWRVHRHGREPYDVPQQRISAPLWVIEGEYRGRHWWKLRLRASRGLLREVGVPCRVHPEQPGRIDIDWSAAYDEHQPAWNRMDAVDRAVTSRRDGPLGKLLAPLEYARLPAFSASEQAAIDQEANAEAERLDQVTGTGAAAVDGAALLAENELIQAEIKDRKRLRKRGIEAFADVVGIEGPSGPGSWLYTVRLQVIDPQGGTRAVERRMGLNDSMVKQIRRKGRVKVRIDPQDPQNVALVIS